MLLICTNTPKYTPGTNVILKRQQRLTEEFVPRADLVLFVLSSDRPLTESEVEFLLYIQQWKKKVMFVLNKADLYQNSSELEEAINFIKKNVGKLLNTQNVILFPVSARLALEAKISASLEAEQNRDGHLIDDLRWRSSGFNELENFLFSFLDGSTDAGMERMRLKLETPIAIATRLLAVTEKLTKQEYEIACEELVSINDLIDGVREFGVKMEIDSVAWKQKIETLIEATKTRMLKLFEAIVKLSNTDLLTTYTIKGDRSTSVSTTAAVQNEILTPALSEMQRILAEYFQWLECNVSEKNELYKVFFDKRQPYLISAENQYYENTGLFLERKQSNRSLQIAENFSASAAAKLFEQEIREVALVTYGGMGAAGLSASLLTSVLPTTLEDLLALAFCSSGGLIAISSFPGRRRKALEKVERVADRLSKEIGEAMKGDMLETITNLESSLKTRAKPYQEAAQRKIERLTKIQEDVALVGQKLQLLGKEIQNINVA